MPLVARRHVSRCVRATVKAVRKEAVTVKAAVAKAAGAVAIRAAASVVAASAEEEGFKDV